MNNKPVFDPPSPKNFHFKAYLQVLKSRSKPKEEFPSKNRNNSPRINRTIKQKPEQSTEQLIQLRKRYEQLQDKYKQLLERVRTRNLEQERMKEEIKVYQKMHERDTQQIQRLRCIIGLINRKTVETQVNEEELQWNHLFRNSRSNKFDQSTEDDIKFKQTAEAFHSKEKPSSRSPKKQEKNYFDYSFLGKEKGRQQRQKTTIDRSKGIFNQAEKELKRVGSGKRLSNSPYSQLRFVPGAERK